MTNIAATTADEIRQIVSQLEATYKTEIKALRIAVAKLEAEREMLKQIVSAYANNRL